MHGVAGILNSKPGTHTRERLKHCGGGKNLPLTIITTMIIVVMVAIIIMPRRLLVPLIRKIMENHHENGK